MLYLSKSRKGGSWKKIVKGARHLHEIALNPGQAAFIKMVLKAGVDLLVEDRDGKKHLI
jgi:hypothetical protein